MRASSPSRLGRWAPWLVVGLGMLVFVSIRLQLVEDEVPNPDISGILYNADALLRGELPYVDNAEFKPPGSFFLAAASFTVFGRSLGGLEVFYALWLLLGAPAIALASLTVRPPVAKDETSSRGPALQAALAVALYLYAAPMFSYNYTSWMLPAYAWAFAGLVRSLRSPGWTWPLVTGAAATAATVIMQRGAVIGPLALVLLLWPRERDPSVRPLPLIGGWIMGACVGALPWAFPYLIRGEVSALLGALFPFGVVADYTSASSSSSLLDTGQLVVALPKLWLSTFPVASACIALGTLLRLGLPKSQRPSAQRSLWLFFAASVVGTGLGGARFYVHYLPQLVPAMALLGAGLAAPPLWRGVASEGPSSTPAAWRHRVAVGAAVLILAGAVAQVGSGKADRYASKARRLTGGQTAAQAAGAHIRARTDPDDTIFGWGWTAWRVYFWADRAAPGRHYKALGTLTTFNTNTAFDPGGDIVFRPGPHADAFIDDFDAHPPAFLVLSPSFTLAFGAKQNPLLEFAALRERIEADYTLDAEFGDLVVLRRKR